VSKKIIHNKVCLGIIIGVLSQYKWVCIHTIYSCLNILAFFCITLSSLKCVEEEERKYEDTSIEKDKK